MKSTCKIQQCLMVFCVSKFQKKWANLRFPLNIRKQKVFQLQGALPPLNLRPGALPLDPAGGSAPRPPYRLVLHALAMAALDCGPPADGKLTKWPEVSKRLDSTGLYFTAITLSLVLCKNVFTKLFFRNSVLIEHLLHR